MKYLTTDLEKISWLRHGFFTRLGGVSTGVYASLNCGAKADKPEHIRANCARVAEALDLASEKLVFVKQVHGVKVRVVKKVWAPDAAPEADALVTAEPGIGLGILTADCTPVLFVDRKKKIIGAAHAGWKGALGGVLESTIDAMKELGAKTKDIEVAIGPCIGPRSYEVKGDFRDSFLLDNKENACFFKPSPKPGHLLFDLPGYVVCRLGAAGVEKVHNIKIDTLPNETSFFSNRRSFLRSEKGFGLQASVISII